jgi:hypothetical protein
MTQEKGFPIRRDLTGEYAIPQGSTWRQAFRLRYRDDEADPWTYWPTSDYTGVMTVRNELDGDVLLLCTTANGRLQLGEQGAEPDIYTILIACSSTITGSIELEALEYGYYDLKVTSPFGHVTPVYHGRIALERQVSD